VIGDIGMGELLVIAVIGFLVFGPDKLPRAIATVMSYVRMLRDQAAVARREIVDAAQIDPAISDDIKASLADIGELHPRRLAASIFTDDPATTKPTNGSGPAAAKPQPGAAPAGFDPDAT
jgi:sec-independent protein translocase protein TatB